MTDRNGNPITFEMAGHVVTAGDKARLEDTINILQQRIKSNNLMVDKMTLNNMPPILLDEHAIAKLLPKLDIKAELTALFRALGEGDAVQPAQTVTDFPTGAGDFITYMGAIKSAGVFGAKLSPYIVTGAKPIITAWTTLMSMQTGQPLV